MLRFSLRTLAGAVTLIALACAALTNASPLIASLSWSVAVLSLAAATVAAVLSTSPRRGFWTGFAIVGWLFLVIEASPLLADLQGSLLTSALLQRVADTFPQEQTTPLPLPATYPAVTPAPPTYATPVTPSAPAYNPPPPVVASPPTGYPLASYVTPPGAQFRESFIHIGNALWILILALAGGLLGQFIVARNKTPAALACIEEVQQ